MCRFFKLVLITEAVTHKVQPLPCSTCGQSSGYLPHCVPTPPAYTKESQSAYQILYKSVSSERLSLVDAMMQRSISLFAVAVPFACEPNSRIFCGSQSWITCSRIASSFSTVSPPHAKFFICRITQSNSK